MTFPAFLAIIVGCAVANAVNPLEDTRWAGQLRMNGYSLEGFGDFPRSWHFVTSRHRTDTGEFRITYANDKAWDDIQRSKQVFQDGAVLAKVGMAFSRDIHFTASKVPGVVQRYQFMVKNAGKFKSTGGWAFAIFDKNGKTLVGAPSRVSQACFACHQIVKSNDYIFSEPIYKKMTSVFGETTVPAKKDSSPKNGYIGFKSLNRVQLPEKLRDLLPDSKAKVRIAAGAIVENIFYGSIEEVRPALAEEAVRTDSPAVLVSADDKVFAAVFKDPDQNASCASSTVKAMPMIYVQKTLQEAAKNVPSYIDQLPDRFGVVRQPFCMDMESN